MPERKLLWVADNLHHPIAISAIEKAVISTQLFNRLHNILQNSTLYLTYPAARTSRFSHSLGTTHVAGRMFLSAIVNAEVGITKRFLDDITKIVREIDSEPRFAYEVKASLPNAEDSRIFNLDYEAILSEPLYVRVLPGLALTSEQRYSFLIAYQTVRLLALTHDLGHPPFSHVTERAIGQIYDWLKALRSENKSLNPRQTEFFEILETVRGPREISRWQQGPPPETEKERKKDQNFHEQLGPLLTDRLLDQVADSFNNDEELCIFIIRIRHLVKRCLEIDRGVYKALHRVIDGKVDADRLDYVPRDLSMTGLSRDALSDQRRLIESCTLVVSNPNDLIDQVYDRSESEYEIIPSARALSTIEEFFHQRFKLYKYAVYHHRVAKTDEILKQVVVTLAKQYLNQSAGLSGVKESKHRKNQLPNDISGLWKVMNPRETILSNDFYNRYIQWDDAWLLTVLRRHYFELVDLNREAKKKGTINKDTGQLLNQLEEILANSKKYYSLIKRADSFEIVDMSFLDRFVSSNHYWSEWEPKLRAKLGMRAMPSKNAISAEDGDTSLTATSPKEIDLEQSLRILKKYASDYKESKEEPSDRNQKRFTSMREAHGFFITAIGHIFFRYGIGGRFGLPFTMNAALEWERENKVHDVLLTHKRILPGVDNSYHITKGDEIIRLGDVSSVADELIRRSKLVPPFYVYYCNEDNDQIGSEELQTSLGECLLDSFSEWLNESQ